MQCINLGIENRDREIRRILEVVRMEDSANIKFKSCSFSMNVFLLTDCLINKAGANISQYHNGGFPELAYFLNAL